ncbi:MAG: ATP-binding protein [Firmicutes bacterium]|nr:ATP-binding protein [Bacillota bacterium]
MQDYNRMLDGINSLTIYKNIANDEIMRILKHVLTDEDNLNALAELTAFLVKQAEEKGFSGNLFRNYINHLIVSDENVFTLFCENNRDVAGSSLLKLAQSDINILTELADTDLTQLPDSRFMLDAMETLMNYAPVNAGAEKPEEKTDIESIIKFHNKNGCGDISVYRVFKYSSSKKALVGIEHPDKITFDDLIGYTSQINELRDNTEAFLNGYPANNILLVGARGTGKSSSVKALINEYHTQGLRLVEITKEQIAELPDILKLLRPRGRKFIVYIDDLSFDENEIQYKYMKSLLEGGSEGKPDNVLFYATSNRRHIIQEKWSDRNTDSTVADIHTADTLNEKLSLSDRFGITITYGKPTPQEYVKIAIGLARKNGIDLSDDEIKQAALRWELNQKGMSGRTAKQFVENLMWEEKKKNGN